MTPELLKRLGETKSEVEWNKICDEIKAAHGGIYPPDWFFKVQVTGLYARAKAGWK